MSPPGPSTEAPTRRVRTWIVVVLVVVALALGAVTVLLLVDTPSGIRDGSGTATITWTSVGPGTQSRPPPQPFSGDIEGHPLTGTSTFVVPTGVSSAGPTPAFRYRGTLAGTRFDLIVSFASPTAPAPGDIATAHSGQYGVRATVAGTFGGSPVRATIVGPPGTGPPPGRPARFAGAIGHHTVTGTVGAPTGTGGLQRVTATFVVGG